MFCKVGITIVMVSGVKEINMSTCDPHIVLASYECHQQKIINLLKILDYFVIVLVTQLLSS